MNCPCPLASDGADGFKGLGEEGDWDTDTGLGEGICKWRQEGVSWGLEGEGWETEGLINCLTMGRGHQGPLLLVHCLSLPTKLDGVVCRRPGLRLSWAATLEEKMLRMKHSAR